MIAFQAAGIGVMFLLFSMASAAQSLLQEEQTGTLERVLNTEVRMGRLLLTGYWLFAALVGFLQISLMFVFGWAVFGVDLFDPVHFAGFLIMTAVTAAAAAAFGLALGTLCRTQAQMSGLSTIVVLLMSALGGSMVPTLPAATVTAHGQARAAHLQRLGDRRLPEGLLVRDRPGEPLATGDRPAAAHRRLPHSGALVRPPVGDPIAGSPQAIGACR